MIGFKECLVVAILACSIYFMYLGLQLYGLGFPHWDTYCLFYLFFGFNMFLLQK